MKKKTPRLSGFKTRTVYRDAYERYASKENSLYEETWTYREAKVKGKKKIVDVVVDRPYSQGQGNIYYFKSVKLSDDGKYAGKIRHALLKTLKEIGVKRHDTRIDISMYAKTSKGKVIKRKLSLYHYNSRKLAEHTVGEIVEQLFYEHGDRPAYPTNIIKGWRGRRVSKKETEKRRQLYNVTFNIKTDHSITRKQAKKKKTKK